MKIFPLSVLAMCACLSGAAWSQTTAKDIDNQLKGKALYLRGGWDGRKLQFDGDGRPKDSYRVLSFNQSGFQESSANMKGTTLRIEGTRFGLAFDSTTTMTRRDLGKLTIEVDGSNGADIQKALDQIVAQSLAAMIPDMPPYWQTFAQHHFLPHDTPARPSLAPTPAVNASPASVAPAHVGGKIAKPTILYQPPAQFSELARAARFSGNVEVYLWVEEDGLPSHIALVKPAGMGLDEQAIAAVQQYRFKPATKAGQPVKVDLYIDVNFQIL